MKVSKVEIKGFRLLSNFSLDLEDGIGDNEYTPCSEDCTTDVENNGLLNTAELTYDGKVVEDCDCIDPPILEIEKVVSSPVALGDGSYDVSAVWKVVEDLKKSNIEGKSFVGIEIPNNNRKMVRLTEILSSKAFKSSPSNLSLALGHDISGNPIVVDLAKMPHLLVAGTTGSGKSVGLNAMLLSLLFKSDPEEIIISLLFIFLLFI